MTENITRMALNCSRAPPPDMSFTLSILAIVATYIVVFVVALVGNMTMFMILVRNQLVKVRRVHSLLLHMNIAHLMVTIMYMPKEILHNYLISWDGGDILCRIIKFSDVFGVALSANILILDRFYSIFFPLYAMRARRSVNHMVIAAWVISFLTSAPNFFLFKAASHPCYEWYTQCVARDFIGEVSKEVVFYNSILNIVQVYFLPLVVTLVCYSLILFRISSGARGVEECGRSDKGAGGTTGGLLRRSTAGNLERARSRTLRMTFIVVLAFLLCWTPYAIVMFLHFTTNIQWIPKEMRKLIYAFAVFNSAITPYLYGYFSFDLKKELRLLAACSKATVSERHLSHSTAAHRRVPKYRAASMSMNEKARRRSASANNFERDLSSSTDLRSSISNGRHSMKVPKRSACIVQENNMAALSVAPHAVYRDRDFV